MTQRNCTRLSWAPNQNTQGRIWWAVQAHQHFGWRHRVLGWAAGSLKADAPQKCLYLNCAYQVALWSMNKGGKHWRECCQMVIDENTKLEIMTYSGFKMIWGFNQYFQNLALFPNPRACSCICLTQVELEQKVRLHPSTDEVLLCAFFQCWQ